MQTVEIVVFFVLLIDSLSCAALTWLGGARWYTKTFRTFSRLFPATKGWATYYLILVMWLGVVMYTAGLTVH